MQEKNKEVVRALYKEFFNEHIVESADKYVREDYIQHNPGVDQGREALKSAFAQKFIEHPDFALWTGNSRSTGMCFSHVEKR